MDLIELDHQITTLRATIKELTKSEDWGAIELAEADLSYLLSLLNN